VATVEPEVLGIEAWQGVDSEIAEAVRDASDKCLRVYETDERRVVADANIERGVTEGGYARRQLFELIQNGADELIGHRGRIKVVLTDDAFYCANQGNPVAVSGVGTLLGSHNSLKSKEEIGRFGLGFKSVLGVSRTPAIYSRTGSFGFDATRSEEVVRRIRPAAERVATLRLAEPIDPTAAAAVDPVLAELMGWAVTVVVAPRDHTDTSWLSEAIRSFPNQFLLFSPQVSELTLDDRTGEGHSRTITLEKEDEDAWKLHEAGDGGGSTSWRLFRDLHHPSASVRDDGGRMSDREVVPISWAVPVSRAAPGQLWAFFPTQEETTLSGVINAPWKLTDDRNKLVPGPFNEELLGAVVRLVLDNLESVNRADDPGFVLELLPGRGRELRGWPDQVLSKAIYEGAANVGCIPDQRGRLQPPAALRVQNEDVPIEAARVWAERAGRPLSWVHPDAVRSDTRRSRVERLMEIVGTTPVSAKEWLEALLTPRKSAQKSASAIRVASTLAHSAADAEMRRAKIVLTSGEMLARPQRGAVYLPAEVDVDITAPIVHRDVLTAADADDDLRTLGILEVSATTILDALVDRVTSDPANAHARAWHQIWDLAHQAGDRAAQEILVEQHSLVADEIMVQTIGGRMAALSSVLLPGDLLSVEDFKVSHRGLLVDIDFHRREVAMFRSLGATDRPTERGGSPAEPWFASYQRGVVSAAVESAQRLGAKVRGADYDLVPSGPFAGPASALDGLAEAPAAKFARELLAVSGDLRPWTLHLRAGGAADVEVEHPILKRVRELDRLPTNKGIRPIGDCVTPVLKEFAGLLPVADLPRPAARALGLPDLPSELDERRLRIVTESLVNITQDDLLGTTYLSLMPLLDEAPDQLRAMVRREPSWVERTDVCAVASVSDLRVLRATGTPFIRLPDESSAERLVTAWGLRRTADVVASQLVFIEDGEPEPVVDAYPLLGQMLGSKVDGLVFVPCRELQRELFTERGSVFEPVEFDVRDGVVHHLASLSEVDRVSRLAERFGVQLRKSEAQQVLDDAQATEMQALLREVRASEGDAQRLALLVEPADLRLRIAGDLLDAVEEDGVELTHVETAQLALHVHGVETLKVYGQALTARGLRVPSQWTGRPATVKFVSGELGFPRTYAGFADTKLDPQVDIAGPTSLPPLHDFQRGAANAIHGLVAMPTDRRGLLSLPTGAGKTRVAVQALVEAMAASTVETPILWVAQTEELCEQAVQSWAEVWRGVGPEDTLRISRLWGKETASPRDDGGHQVVVATIDKLVSHCVDNVRFEWLRLAGVVLIDEAHASTAPTYRKLMDWAEVSDSDSRAPLIGLSATPFRNDEDLTRSLSRRYSERRLDKGVSGEKISISLLQQKRILAQLDHRELDGSAGVPVNAKERDHFRQFADLPTSVLNKIGGDSERTNRLVRSVMELPEDWPVIMFATSVAHAKTLAGLLNREGRTAAAVDGNTPPSIRRHLISEFKAGRLRTLTNYGVLTQGFDAPSVRALYIARPTYSPNLYQQMIGRGLRGPENGGSETCLVVDVKDNIDAFGKELAFREFEYLWKR